MKFAALLWAIALVGSEAGPVTEFPDPVRTGHSIAPADTVSDAEPLNARVGADQTNARSTLKIFQSSEPTAPTQVRKLKAISTATGLRVSWSAPSRTGNAPSLDWMDPATGVNSLHPVLYIVNVNGSSIPGMPTARTVVSFDSVLPGVNTVEVIAYNSSGFHSSATIQVRHAKIPWEPELQFLEVTALPRSLKVDLPADRILDLSNPDSVVAQGAVVSSVEVLAYRSGTTVPREGTPPTPVSKCVMASKGRNSFSNGCPIAKLTNGEDYQLYFRAKNARGWSDVSPVANSPEFSPTPVAPDPPRNVKLTLGSGSVRVSWNPPVFDGGSPLDYSWLGGPANAAVGYLVFIDYEYVASCLPWRTSCDIPREMLTPGSYQFIQVGARNNHEENIFRPGVYGTSYAQPQLLPYPLHAHSIEDGRLRLNWYAGPENIWDPRGAEITSVEVLVVRHSTLPHESVPRPIARCTASKSRARALPESCLVPRLNPGTWDAYFDVYLRSRNKGGWSEPYRVLTSWSFN